MVCMPIATLSDPLNALRRVVRQKAITRRRGAEAVRALQDMRLARYLHAPLRERVWALRDSLTAHDASYLALAEGLEERILPTADAALASVARRSLGDHGVREVA